jgi:hypothetical protein
MVAFLKGKLNMNPVMLKCFILDLLASIFSRHAGILFQASWHIISGMLAPAIVIITTDLLQIYWIASAYRRLQCIPII